MSRRLKDTLFILAGVLLGAGVSLTTTLVLAHGGDTSKIHSCVDDTTGAIKIVGENDSCGGGEHALDWDKDASASANFGLPFMCYQCQLSAFGDKFAGKDFSNAQIQMSNLDNTNLTGVIFKHGNLNRISFEGSDLTGADLSNLEDSGQNDFIGANLTNTNLSNSSQNSSSFSNANLQNTNFENDNLGNTNFTGATNMDTANLTNVTWDGTTCPDGTSSNDNSNTCVGHLTP